MRYREKNKYKRKYIPIDQLDAVEILDDASISYREKGKNVGEGWIGVCCPFCSDNNYHLGINLIHKTISCFKCGTSGTIIKYLSEELNSFNKALQIIGNHIPKELKSFVGTHKERTIKVKLPEKANRKITKYHAGYLKSRGFEYQELLDLYNLHFVGPIGEFSNHIIIPIIHNYQLITFTSIDISDVTEIRYKHLSEEKSIIHAREWLFGIEHTNKNTCCLVEGIFDMMRIGPGAVCSFGAKVTSKQLSMLKNFNKVIICFDGDDPGRTNAEKIANDLAAFTDVEILNLPDEKDPDSLDKEDIEFIRNKIGK